MVPMNATIVCEFDELCGHILPTLVILKFFDFRINLVFSYSLEQFKGFEGLAFASEASRSEPAQAVS